MKKTVAKVVAAVIIVFLYFLIITNIIADRSSAQLEAVEIRWLGDRWGIE